MIEYDDALQAKKDRVSVGSLEYELKQIVRRISNRVGSQPTDQERARIKHVKGELKEIKDRGLL